VPKVKSCKSVIFLLDRYPCSVVSNVALQSPAHSPDRKFHIGVTQPRDVSAGSVLGFHMPCLRHLRKVLLVSGQSGDIALS
jgi:hypothetical protein